MPKNKLIFHEKLVIVYNALMLKKSNIIFLALFIGIYLLLQFTFRTLADRQEKLDTQQTRIIQENVKERFKTFLKLPLSIGMLGADIFATGDLKTKPYGAGLEASLLNNSEILGLTIIGPDGRILRVNPEGSNPATIGKITQNIEALKKSINRGEKYWLSQPFQLFQGPKGFALYLPILENKTLKGWFAIVISTELFTQRFELSEYSHVYDLMIKDADTGSNYFTTFDTTYQGAVMHELPVNVMNRNLVFLSWRKQSEVIMQFPWWVSFALALLVTIGLKLITYLFEQKRRAHAQLNDINALLHMTSAEALSKLVDMHHKFNAFELTANQKENFSEAVTYLKHLIEQIDLLQTMSLSDENLHQEMHGFFPLLLGQIKNFNEIIQQKHLKLNYSPENLDKVLISADGWPLQNSVLSSILSHSIVYAKNGSQISIENKSSDESYYITFHTHQINREGPDGEATQLDRRLEVARRILQIYKGQLFIQNDLNEGMLIRIMLPIHN
jgi:sensor domain CHASE-containing protein